MRNLSMLILLGTILLSAKCKKEKNPPVSDNAYGLPNASTSGLNVFACRANEENWVVQKGSSTMSAGIYNDSLRVSGSAGDLAHFSRLVLVITQPLETNKTYILGKEVNAVHLLTNKTCVGLLGGNVQREVSVSGALTITRLDRPAKIVSGIFECDIPVNECDTLKIREGRFDIRYF